MATVSGTQGYTASTQLGHTMNGEFSDNVEASLCLIVINEIPTLSPEQRKTCGRISVPALFGERRVAVLQARKACVPDIVGATES